MNLNKSKFKNNEKNRLTSITIIYILIILVLIYIVIKPTANNIKKIRDEIIAQKIDREKIINREKNISLLSTKLKKIEPKIEKLDNIFVNQSRKREFITTLQDVANKTNIQSPKITPQNAINENTDYQKIPITIVATGPFNNIMNYILELEQLDYYIDIYSLNVVTNSKGTNTNSNKNLLLPGLDTNLSHSITLTIKADTYWEK